MSEQRFKAAITDLIEGLKANELHIRAVSGEHIVVELGPNQIVSLKRHFDRYVAEYEADEIRAK